MSTSNIQLKITVDTASLRNGAYLSFIFSGGTHEQWVAARARNAELARAEDYKR